MRRDAREEPFALVKPGTAEETDTIMILGSRAALALALVSLLHITASVKSGQGRRPKSKTARLFLDPSAQPGAVDTSASSIANMSLSPWTHIDSGYVASRFPNRISQARCLTSGCLSPNGGGQDAALEAKPINYQVLVLHKIPKKSRKNKGGKKARRRYVYRLETELITVGCTCVRPSVLPQQ